MKKRIGWVDTMKCICILFVMLAHLESGSPVLDAVYTPVFLTGFLFAAGYTYVPEDDFPDKSFSAYADFDAMQSLDAVESELCEEIVEQLCEDIFNATVANW